MTALTYWRSNSGFEVDFILDDKIAIEVKSTAVIHDKHLKGLKSLREEGIINKFILVCSEPRQRLIDGIHIIPWQVFLKNLWDDTLIGDLYNV